MFLSSYRDTHGNFGELEKSVETLACQLMFSQHFSFNQTTTCVCITRKKQVTCFLFFCFLFFFNFLVNKDLDIQCIFYLCLLNSSRGFTPSVADFDPRRSGIPRPCGKVLSVAPFQSVLLSLIKVFFLNSKVIYRMSRNV